MIEDSKKKIIFIIGSMRRGGAERVISILANEYSDNGWEVQIITLLDNSNDYILRDSIKVINITDDKKSRIQKIPFWLIQIRRTFKQFNPDVIVSFIARINILTLIASLGLNKKIIISERNDPKSDSRTWFIKMATYLLYPLADAIVFQTTWAKNCFPKYIQKKGIIIRNPVYLDVKATEMKDNKIVAVGRLLEQKNHKLLINAFSKVIEKYPDYKLYIYGEGKLRRELVNQVEELNISDNVFMPGNVLNIHEKISDAEMFVLSSDYEGLSNALLEAMMMGLPCISTNCAGSNEVIEHEKNGLLVPIKDAKSLSESIVRLIQDRELAEKLGKNAMACSVKFKSENVINDWKKVIEEYDSKGARL